MSARVSGVTSQQQSPAPSQDSQDQDREELKEAYCCYCNCITSKLIGDHYKECNIRERFDRVVGKYGRHWKTKLFDFEQESNKHITLFPYYNQMFNEFKSSLYEDDMEALQLFDTLQEDLQDSVFRQLDTPMDEQTNLSRTKACHCSLCGSNFQHIGAKFQHYSVCLGLKEADERVAAQYSAFAENASEREKQLIQTALGHEGSVVKSAVSKVDLIQQQGSSSFKKEFIDSPDLIKLAKLHEELHDPTYFNVLVQNIIAGPVADAQGNPVYAQNSTRENLVSMLGKTSSRKSNSSLEKAVTIKLKKEAGIALTLDERRSLEADDIKAVLQKYEGEIMHIRDYLSGFKDMRSRKPFQKVKATFCDGIILPRLQQLFKTYNDFQAAFHFAGIQVQKICPGQKDGFVYVRLWDSANEFNTEFILKLNALIQRLRKQLEDLKENQEIIAACFIQQIDCTQDMKGFFLSFDVKNDIKQLSELMNMELTHDYPTFESLFTLLQKYDYGIEDQPFILKQTRFKIYNKLLHFLESEQGKKKISMNLKGLLNCSSEFYQKLLECFESGLSRLEFSHYFYSFEESQKINVKQYQQQIDHAFEQVNKLPQIRYDVLFEDFFNNFWNCSKPILIFQKDSWTVIYAKHSISAYVGQTVKINQERFNNSDKIECIKRFGIPGRWCSVVDETSGKAYKVRKTGSKVMQIPVQSLNTTHSKSYDFPFNETIFKYHMSTDELDEVSLVLQNGKEFEFVGIVTTNQKKRDKKSRGKKEIASGTDITEFALHHKTKKDRWITIQHPNYQYCKFTCKLSTGRTYSCNHCSLALHRRGKSQLVLIND